MDKGWPLIESRADDGESPATVPETVARPLLTVTGPSLRAGATMSPGAAAAPIRAMIETPRAAMLATFRLGERAGFTGSSCGWGRSKGFPRQRWTSRDLPANHPFEGHLSLERGSLAGTEPVQMRDERVRNCRSASGW